VIPTNQYHTKHFTGQLLPTNLCGSPAESDLPQSDIGPASGVAVRLRPRSLKKILSARPVVKMSQIGFSESLLDVLDGKVVIVTGTSPVERLMDRRLEWNWEEYGGVLPLEGGEGRLWGCE
jgi:hypothetical protein